MSTTSSGLSSDLAQLLVAELPDLLIVCDLDGAPQYVSPAIGRVLGYRAATAPALALAALVSLPDTARFQAWLAELQNNAPDADDRLRYHAPHQAGHLVEFEARGRLIRNPTAAAAVLLVARTVGELQPVPAEVPVEVPISAPAGRAPTDPRVFQAVFETATPGLTIFRAVRDAGGEVVDFEVESRNSRARHLLNLPAPDEGFRLRLAYPMMHESGLFEHFRTVLLTGEPWRDLLCYQDEHIDGWFEVSAVRLNDDCICESFTDQTAVHRAEALIANSQTRLALGAEVAGVGLTERDLVTQQVHLTPQYARLVGLDAATDTISLRALQERLHPDAAGILDAPVEAAAYADDSDYEVRVRFRRFNDDCERIFLTRARAVRDGAGRPVRVLAATLDVTESDAQAARASAVEGQLTLAARLIGLGISERELGTPYLAISPEYARVMGFPAGTVRVMVEDVLRCFDPEDVANILVPYQKTLEQGEVNGPVRVRGKRRSDGAPFVLLAMAHLLPGAPARIQSAIIDITRLAQAETQAVEAQTQLALAAEAAGLGISVRQTDNDQLTITPAFARLYGLPPDSQQIALQTVLDLTRPEDLATQRPPFVEGLQTPNVMQQVQFRIRRADTGAERVLLSMARSVAAGGGLPHRVLSVSLDVTDLTRARAAAEQLRYWKTLADGLPEILWVADEKARGAQFLNQRWYAYTGQTEQTLPQQTWSSALHPDDFADPTLLQQVREMIGHGSNYELKFRLRRHDGAYRWFLTRTVPLRDAAGQITNWVGLTIDIHEREVAERRLRRANADLDTFVYTAAHDLKAPIDNLEAIVTALQEELTDWRARMALPRLDAVQDGLLDHATRAVARFRHTLGDMAQVIDALDGNDASAPAPLDLATAVADLLLDMDPYFAASQGLLCCDLRVTHLTALPSRHLRTVLFNLISNALKYRQPARPARLWLRSRLISADRMELTLTDNGIGLDPRRAARAFELFGRLHPGTAEGAGIGLFIVRRVVEQAGGTLRVNGRVGEGTSVSLRLPYHEK